MTTACFGKSLAINELKDDKMRILAEACRIIDDEGRKAPGGEIQVEIFMTKANYLATTIESIYDKLRVEVKNLSTDDTEMKTTKDAEGQDVETEVVTRKATDLQKLFAELTIEN